MKIRNNQGKTGEFSIFSGANRGSCAIMGRRKNNRRCSGRGPGVAAGDRERKVQQNDGAIGGPEYGDTGQEFLKG
ncbi:hypothetical protein [Anaerotalea alkaliphila]|uniref:Uncharacterized protein n=1 Tax=Anaerotalea alkaliphila TaxID=2662126 RepID=A0A7X5HVR4_9FIRM|nr:hypothetical protein [Anaerotalea alkaliphila]NDL67545.1 hypothetical protein [Anaerotalea alkaliphila]